MKQLYYARIISTLAFGLLLLAGLHVHAQAPVWQSALAVGTASNSTSNLVTVATDANGNVLVAGDFKGTITLGSNTLTSGGVQSAFVAKWNPLTNTWAWALPLTHTAESSVNKLAVVGNSIYLAGSFSNTVTIGMQALSSAGFTDLYVAKLTDNGTSASVNWAQQAGGTSLELCRSLAVQGSNVYIVGQANSSVTTFGSTYVNASAGGTAFVAKLVDAGNTSSWTWAQAVGSTASSEFNAVTVQGSNVYVSGDFSGTLVYASSQITTTGPTNFDPMVIKLTDQGTSPAPGWVQQLGRGGSAIGTSLASVGSAVYVGGFFGSSTLLIGSNTLTNQGSFDTFVAKLVDAGATSSVAWAQSAGGAGSENLTALVVQGNSVYIGGDFNGSAAAFGPSTLVARGTTDAFVARLVDAGSSATVAWGIRAGGMGSSSTNALAVRGTQVLVAGITSGIVPFGNQTISVVTGNNYGFLASFTDGIGLAATTPVVAEAPGQLYPNPAHDYTRVVVPHGARVATLTLLDMLGRAVSSQVAVPAEGVTDIPVDLTGLRPGVYGLHVVAGDVDRTTRLVVE